MSRVLIVGGLSGIGKAVVDELKRDFEVETLSRRSTISSDIVHHSVDVTKSDALRQYFASSQAYDHLVVTAADTPIGALHLLSDDKAKYAINNKLWLAYVASRDIPWLSSLTLVSGFLSARPNPSSSLQSALNAAIEGLTRGIAVERAPARANCISPGTVDCGLWEKIDSVTRERAMKKAAERALVGKAGAPGDIAMAIRFSIECQYLTGETIFVDGGARIGPS